MAEFVTQNRAKSEREQKILSGLSPSRLSDFARNLTLCDQELVEKSVRDEAKRLDVYANQLMALLMGNSPGIMAELLTDDRQKEIISDNALRPLAFLSAVESNNIDSAVGMMRKAIEWSSEKAHCDHKALLAAVRSEVQGWREAEASGYAPLSANQKLFAGILDTQVLPTSNIWKTFKHFPEDQHKFLRSILSQYGENFGSQVLDELRVIFSAEPAELASESKMVAGFINTGYRGFSAQTYIAYRDAYRRSPFEARKLLQDWSRISRSLLNGREVSSELRDNPLYDEFVYGAYRPARFSGNVNYNAPPLDMGSVSTLISMAEGYNRHLARFKYPLAGYPVELATASRFRIEKPESRQRLDECLAVADCLQSPDVEKSLVARELSRLLLGASSEIDKKQLLAFAVQKSGKNGELRELARGTASAAELQQIRTLRLLLGDAFEEQMERLFPEVAGEIRLSGKIENAVRRALKLPADARVSTDDVKLLLSAEMHKVFEKEMSFLGALEKEVAPGASGNYRMYLSKASHAFLARSSAALCTTQDLWSWQNPNYLQMTMVDQDLSRIVGVIQLHLTEDLQGRKAVMARINPTEFFVDRVDKAALARAMLTTIQQFADDNDLMVYLAEQGPLRMQTNRNSFLPFLERYFGEKQVKEVQVTGSEYQNVQAMYALRKELLSEEVSKKD